MRLKSVDYIYVLLSCVLGIWQAWCLNYPSNGLLLAIPGSLWSLPFALASYAHASLLKKAGIVNQHPDWKRVLVLWAGMPLSLVAFSLTGLMETQIMSVFYRTADNLPLFNLRVLIAEGVGSVVWAVCLLVWSGRPSLRVFLRSLPTPSAILFASALSAYGLATLLFRSFHKDMLLVLTSTVTTAVSAVILIVLRNKIGQSVEVSSGAEFDRL